MVSDNPRLLKAIEQKRKAEESIKKIKAQENAKSRKLNTRRKILLGVILEKMLLDGLVSSTVFNEYLNTSMKSDRDKKVFENYLRDLELD